ncbi:MAG: MFS transporter [Desulfobacter sp.]|nr:MAG: MFS transporter [Desulfobacter sp.]
MKKHSSAIALNLSVFIYMFGVGVIVPLLPQKIIDLTGSLTTVGWLASAFALPFVLLQFPMGRLSGRYGFRRFLLGGYIICSLSGLFYAFSDSREAVFFGRLLQGMGEAPLWALAPALLSMRYPAAKGRAIGIYNAAIHMGLTLGSGFGILAAGYWKSNEFFLLFSLLGAAGAVIVLWGAKDPRMPRIPLGDGADWRGLKRLLKQPAAIAVLSGIILYGAGYGTSITVLPGFLIQAKGFTQAQAGFYFLLFYTGIGLSQIITGPLSDRCGRRRTMVWGLLMAAAGFWQFPGRTGWMVYPWLFLASAGLGVFCVAALAWLNNSVEDALKGTVSGAFYLFWGMGYFSGPLLSGRAQEGTGGLTGFQFLALLFLVQALSQVVIRRRKLARTPCN